MDTADDRRHEARAPRGGTRRRRTPGAVRARWLGVVSVSLLVAGVATAQQTGIPWTDTTRTHSAGVSGLRGTAMRPVSIGRDATRSYWLREMAFRNVNVQVCDMVAITSSATTTSPTAGLTWQPAEFIGTASGVGACRNAAVAAGAPVHRVRTPGPHHYVRGVRVCTDTQTGTSTTSIRGVRFQLAEVRGSELVDGGREEMILPGCNHWHPPVSCPDGELAKGAIAHHGGGAAMRGIELECAPIIERPGAVGRGAPPNVRVGTSSASTPPGPR